jgi:hypothetical protein
VEIIFEIEHSCQKGFEPLFFIKKIIFITQIIIFFILIFLIIIKFIIQINIFRNPKPKNLGS